MIYLGLSGGMDSVALFMEYVTTKTDFKCIHVNHNQSTYDVLSQSFCENLCRLHCIELYISNVYATNETNARELRYKEYLRYVSNDDVLVLGHHIDDSVETSLLNILNGTSVFGARGIDEVSKYRGMTVNRPFITSKKTKKDIKDYLHSINVEYVDDKTNLDLNIKRNYLRHIVIPCLNKLFPNSVSKLLGFGNQCRKQSSLNESLARYSQDTFKAGDKFTISLFNDLPENEKENWFFIFCRDRQVYLASRHYTEFLNFVTNDNYKRVVLGDIVFIRDEFYFEVE